MKTVAPPPADAASAPMVFPSLLEIKRELPPDCFEASATRSLFFTARAFTIAALLIVSFHTFRQLDVVQHSFLLNLILSSSYIGLQGVNFWGFFTIGHDCGHGAFSRYHFLNFIIGVLTHSVILTPFEGWKLSHRLHHKNTGNIDQDEIFYPNRKSTENKPARQSILSLGFAWFLYELMGFPLRTVAHEELRDTIFSRNVMENVLSIMGHLICVIGALVATYTYGMTTMGLYYWAPLFVFATMLVVTTFLHHNDEETPWYADSEWTYVKGNLSSVDRSYGWLINHMSHNIGTHQVHHLFPIIPHYKLIEATVHFRKAFPHLVRKSEKPIVSAFFSTVILYIKHGVCADDELVFSLKKSRQAATKLE